MLPIQDVARNIWDTYQLSKPIYGSTVPIYQCKVPIFPTYKKLYDALIFINTHERKLYERLENIVKNSIDKENISITLYAVSQFIESVPDEYKPILHVLLGVIAVAYLGNKQVGP